MSDQCRDPSLREIMEKPEMRGTRAYREWEALITVLLDFAIQQAARSSSIAGVWTDEARRALLDAHVPGRSRS